jgi:hypothetical protein
MAEGSPRSEKERRRRSAAALFLKVHDLAFDDAAAAQRPVTRLRNLMISEGLLTDSDGLRVCAATVRGAPVQFHRAGAWSEFWRQQLAALENYLPHSSVDRNGRITPYAGYLLWQHWRLGIRPRGQTA